FVRTCDLCQRRKSSTARQGLLQPMPIPTRPFACVGIDFLGPFPTSRQNNQYIIVSVDYLTRFAETRAVPRANALAVAQFYLERIVLRHGAPSHIISDRGKAFVSKFLKEVFRLCQSVHRKTTAYHPQCNGLTERLNHTLTDMLSMYVDRWHKNWDVVLPIVTYAYNTSAQAATGYTPIRLVYGREVVTPLDAIFQSSTSHDVRSQSYLLAAEEGRRFARDALQKSQELQSFYYNQTHLDVTFAPGDLVMVWFPTRRVGLSE